MPLTTVQAGMLDTTAQYYSFKNRIINGAMVIDQRNAGASITPSVNPTYGLDRWENRFSQASKYSVQQSTDSPVGFTNSMLLTSTSAYSVGTNETFYINQKIEGYNTADLGWGTANAQLVTLSFWVKSSLTGTFGGAIRNDSGTVYSYPFSFTISSANTWEYKTVTIPGSTAGTWPTTSGTGIRVAFSLGTGSTLSGTAGSWSANNYFSTPSATSVVGTNGATFYITGVQLEKGSTATSFDYRPYGTELALCQRYVIVYGRDQNYNEIGGTGFAYSTTRLNAPVSMPVQMRSTPTISNSGALQASDGASATALTAIGIITQQSSSLIASLEGTTASGLTAFRPYRIETNNSTTPFVLLSAEL